MASPLPLASSLLQATIEALRRQAPFSDMDEADLGWTAERLSLAYFPQDAALIEADGKPPAYLFIVKQGVVEGEAPDGKGGRLLQLTDGEMFPLGALLAGRAAVNRYVAAADTFCYRLPAADFHSLLERSRAFGDFCTRRIASLLEQSQRAVQSEYALALDDENRFSRPVRALIRQAPVAVRPDTPLAEALAAMDAARVGSVVVSDPQGCPMGILTLKDVLQRVTLLRRTLVNMKPIEAMEMLVKKIGEYSSNAAFLDRIDRHPGTADYRFEAINNALRARLDEVTERWGVKVTNVEIREIIPPREVQEAMNRQMSAERIRRAVVTESNGTREAAINVADGEKQSAILRAEGDKQSAILRAEGEREAQLLRAEGFSNALERIFGVAQGIENTHVFTGKEWDAEVAAQPKPVVAVER